jgi:SAM-dependent methyltransferase
VLRSAFGRSARVYDALLRHKDYAAASERVHDIVRRLASDATSLLDVGCGTGQHLQHLGRYYRAEGIDLSPEMLAIARERCPATPLHQISLVDFRLGRCFDVVTCLFGSIGYTVTNDNLQRAVRSMAVHLDPGGICIIEPWITPERFVSGRLVFDSANDPDLKVARMYVARAVDRVSVFESNYLVATSEGVTHFAERQELGLFTDEEYRLAFTRAGLDVVDSSGDLFGYGLYVCVKRDSGVS